MPDRRTIDPDPGPSDGDHAPWIETRAGSLFFLNALLVAPAAMALVPLGLGAALRGLGVLVGPSPLFDTIPRVARYFAPRLGWLAAPAAVVAWKGLGVVDRKGPRRALIVFLVAHVATVAYTVWRWVAA
ncbi:MAG: hypothetical protein PVI57_09225 [Gemmatimonadota bacterium]